MNLSEYVESLIQFLEDNPELSEAEVVYYSDEEGNNLHLVKSEPGTSHVEDLDSHYLEDSDESGILVVSIN